MRAAAELARALERGIRQRSASQTQPWVPHTDLLKKASSYKRAQFPRLFMWKSPGHHVFAGNETCRFVHNFGPRCVRTHTGRPAQCSSTTCAFKLLIHTFHSQTTRVCTHLHVHNNLLTQRRPTLPHGACAHHLGLMLAHTYLHAPSYMHAPRCMQVFVARQTLHTYAHTHTHAHITRCLTGLALAVFT